MKESTHKNINSSIATITLCLTIIALLFTLYTNKTAERVSMKNQILLTFIKWQKAKLTLACYYNQATDKSVFSKEIIDAYTKDNNGVKLKELDLKENWKIIDNASQETLNMALNEKLNWTYNNHRIFYRHMSAIKDPLSQSELQSALRVCEHSF